LDYLIFGNGWYNKSQQYPDFVRTQNYIFVKELKMRIYVTGGTGLVGSNVIKIAQERYQAEIIAAIYGPPPDGNIDYQLDPLDMGDLSAIQTAIQHYKPDVVIHCAALLDQGAIHKKRQWAWSNMVGSTRAFARACHDIGSRLIFVSTDWVFDGREPLVDEDSPPFPVNFYGIMKMASERELSTMDGLNYGVGRLAGVYGFNYAIPAMTRWVQGVGFGDLPNYYTDCFSKNQPVRIWSDHVNEAAHPTLASDGADMLLRLAQHDENGTFHCFGNESIDRVELAHRTASLFGGDPALIQSVPLDADVRAEFESIPIPFRTIASTDKTAQALGRRALNVDEGLRAFKREWETFQITNE
jgi:dTDP-4-dehydrorhamnose reductase